MFRRQDSNGRYDRRGSNSYDYEYQRGYARDDYDEEDEDRYDEELDLRAASPRASYNQYAPARSGYDQYPPTSYSAYSSPYGSDYEQYESKIAFRESMKRTIELAITPEQRRIGINANVMFEAIDMVRRYYGKARGHYIEIVDAEWVKTSYGPSFQAIRFVLHKRPRTRATNTKNFDSTLDRRLYDAAEDCRAILEGRLLNSRRKVLELKFGVSVRRRLFY